MRNDAGYPAWSHFEQTTKNISRRCFVHRQTHSSSDFEFSVRNVRKRLDEGSRYFRFCCNPASCNNTLARSLCPRTKRPKSIVRLSLFEAHWEFFKPILYVERFTFTLFVVLKNQPFSLQYQTPIVFLQHCTSLSLFVIGKINWM